MIPLLHPPVSGGRPFIEAPLVMPVAPLSAPLDRVLVVVVVVDVAGLRFVLHTDFLFLGRGLGHHANYYYYCHVRLSNYVRRLCHSDYSDPNQTVDYYYAVEVEVVAVHSYC